MFCLKPPLKLFSTVPVLELIPSSNKASLGTGGIQKTAVLGVKYNLVENLYLGLENEQQYSGGKRLMDERFKQIINPKPAHIRVVMTFLTWHF